eukprot:scaffold272_cov137-Pinguiococcus_pyrenoidosus.AAC.2
MSRRQVHLPRTRTRPMRVASGSFAVKINAACTFHLDPSLSQRPGRDAPRPVQGVLHLGEPCLRRALGGPSLCAEGDRGRARRLSQFGSSLSRRPVDAPVLREHAPAPRSQHGSMGTLQNSPYGILAVL